MTVRFSVTVRQVREDGSEAPLDGELAAALAAPAEQFAGLAAWAAIAVAAIQLSLIGTLRLAVRSLEIRRAHASDTASSTVRASNCCASW